MSAAIFSAANAEVSFFHVERTGSTNADLARMVRSGLPLPALLVADHQTAGKGRLGRDWTTAPDSALLVSFAFSGGEPVWRHGTVVALSARAALDSLDVSGVTLKWPNDLVVTEAAVGSSKNRAGKLAGVLGELVDASTAVIGIGVNVEPSLIETATSVRQLGSEVGRDEVLAALLTQIAARRHTSWPDLLDETRSHSSTLGAQVRVERGRGELVMGQAVDLDPSGALLVVDDDGVTHTITVGDVTRLRPRSSLGPPATH